VSGIDTPMIVEKNILIHMRDGVMVCDWRPTSIAQRRRSRFQHY
jgi:hypothetical protein